jgi:hypothetical protein
VRKYGRNIIYIVFRFYSFNGYEYQRLGGERMTNKERVSNNLQITVDGIKSEKVQEVATSLAIIAQCQIDTNYTLAMMLDEMQTEGLLDKVKQAREEMKKLANHKVRPISCEQEVAVEMCIAILDKLIESEEK